MPAEFDKRVVVITGSGREKGIGAATALEFADRGAAAVVITTRQEANPQAANILRKIKDKGARGHIFVGDLLDEDTQKRLIGDAASQYGRFDVLVNNAGILKDRPANGLRRSDWDLVMNTIARTSWETAKAAFRHFNTDEGGAVVNIGSVVGEVGNRGQINYAAAKGALTLVTLTLAQEWAGRNVRVNQIDPGFIETDMTEGVIRENERPLVAARTPLKRFGTAQEVAFWVANASSPRAAFTTGAIIRVDGGIALANLANMTSEVLAFRAAQSAQPQ